ncbi:hypothetical protein BUALT_Bualt02G0193500 [Buddleja alternifolia]|uniref:Solute carrier family 35 member F5 n=1 Tax=Buddleja alternifolia TaxID=168488 RepID=A0AAV6Y2R5_9LAMI|nr:hypothetical protein BUALT_Bualt02G0193500 [Buddleja alternifolia]
MNNQVWNWVLGLIYIFLVATIWIGASFVVQEVVDEGVSPFLVTYICNSLFVVFIPLVEIGRYLEDKYGSLLFWRNKKVAELQDSGDSEEVILLENDEAAAQSNELDPTLVAKQENGDNPEGEVILGQNGVTEDVIDTGLDAKGRWTRVRVAKVSLLICPIWFLAQLTFNLSLKYTTVTSNTVLSTTSSLFTFLVALVFLGEKFTWLKLSSVLLCMGGTIIVSLGDSEMGLSAVASNPVLGDVHSLLSSAFYAVYVTLIRLKLPDADDEVRGRVSMAQFLGFLGLFNLVIFFPVALVLDFAKLEPFNMLTEKQFGIVVGKASPDDVKDFLFLVILTPSTKLQHSGLLDNVLSDYLWAKAVLLTTTTVATAGLSIQVPLAAIVDSLTGNAPNLLDYIGGAAIMVGFAGITIPSDALCSPKEVNLELETGNLNSNDRDGL